LHGSADAVDNIEASPDTVFSCSFMSTRPSSDGAIAGFQLGTAMPSWQSSETPAGGTVITIPIIIVLQPGPIQVQTGYVYLQQQLPQELTN
jgi:hypothetical protein